MNKLYNHKRILGLSFDYHDSAAALIVNGQIIAAAEEERFSRIKHDSRFPKQAISFCLSQAKITPDDIDAVIFHEDTLLKLDRIVSSYVKNADQAFDYLLNVLNLWGQEGKMDAKGRIARHLNIPLSRIHSIGHHESHAASAFYLSPFDRAAIVTLDGVGEYDTMAVSLGNGTKIDRLYSVVLPHSLGLIYSAFTAFLGFEVNEGEYKVMGMAGFGQPRFVDLIRAMITLKDDGTFTIDQSYFIFECPTSLPFNEKLIKLFGPPRKPESLFRVPLTGSIPEPGSVEALSSYYADIACSLQRVTEEVILHIVSHAMRNTGLSDVCIAGGVGLNSLANARLKRELGCRLFVQPASGDSGAALGAAFYHWHHILENSRGPAFVNAYLGRGHSDEEIQIQLSKHNLTAHVFADDASLIQAAVNLGNSLKIHYQYLHSRW
jgi:carbamoyltransferase